MISRRDTFPYTMYMFGLNEGWIVYLAHTDNYALVLAYEGDYDNCIISSLYDTEDDALRDVRREADGGLFQDIPEWKYEPGSWSERYAAGEAE